MDQAKFAKLRLLYKITNHISEARQNLIKDLVAYVDDPVRYQRRMRLLTQLADYEHQLWIKFNSIDNDPCHFDDQMIRQLQDEINLITDTSS